MIEKNYNEFLILNSTLVFLVKHDKNLFLILFHKKFKLFIFVNIVYN